MTSTVDVTVGSDLLALLAQNSAACERDGRIVPENIEALTRAGMFRLLAPASRGGLEVTPARFVEICSELGRGCSSCAWVVSIMNSCTWALSRFPAAVQESLFAGTSAPMVCGVVAPTGECLDRQDHLEVTGSWAYASGCLHAKWALLGVRNVDDVGETVGISVALVPMNQLTIERTWDAVGLAGTGSHTVTANRASVPLAYVIGMDVAASVNPSSSAPTLFRNALVPILALALAGPLIGMAHGALDRFDRDFAQARIGTSAGLAADARARVVSGIESVRSTAAAAAADAEAWAARGARMPALDQAKVKLDVATIARDARAAVDGLLDIAGVRGFCEDSELARYWRDLAVGSRHGMLNYQRVSEEYGRLLLG